MPSALSPAGLDRVLTTWRTALGVPTGDNGSDRTLVERDDLDAIITLRLGDAVFVAAPSAALARVRAEPESVLLDAAALASLVPGSVPLGTADLAYLERLRPSKGPATTRAATAADITTLHADTSDDEWNESGVDELASRWAIDAGDGTLAAIAGFSIWRGAITQLGVVSTRRHRHQGFAAAVASTAATAAIQQGHIPQWRSRVGNAASLAIGERLGFIRLGTQATVLVNQ